MGRNSQPSTKTIPTTVPQPINMHSVLPTLALAAFAAAVPAPHNHDEAWAQQGNVVSQGPWVENLSYERGPKEIASPPTLLGMASGFWDWDREVVKKGIFENENIMIHAAQTTTPTARQQKSLSLTEAADEVLAAIRSFEHRKPWRTYRQTNDISDNYTSRLNRGHSTSRQNYFQYRHTKLTNTLQTTLDITNNNLCDLKPCKLTCNFTL